MLKVISPDSFDFGEAPLQLVKYSSRGLVGSDLSEFIKRAGDQAAARFRNVPFAPGEIPIHLIALGTTESIGPNRNGDGFKEANCKDFHETFKKYARWYRNHANKDKTKSYGIVKDSFFNDAMKRIELLVAWNGTKEAADKNGGLLADKEMQSYEAGKHIPVSMSCRIEHDECSGCGNKARTRDEYCDDKKCIKYGGLKKNMARTFEDGHILHADNPSPCFFDISGVYRPADRIAYVLGKVASDQIKGGAQLAEELGISAPLDVIASISPASMVEQIESLKKLAESANNIAPSTQHLGYRANSGIFEDYVIPKPGSARMYSVLRAFRDHKIAMSLPDFLSMLGVVDEKLEKVSEVVGSNLQGVFSRILEDNEIEAILKANPYRTKFAMSSEKDRSWAHSKIQDFSLKQEHVQSRLWKSAIRRENKVKILTKEASNIDNDASEFFARQYALYKVAFLTDLELPTDDLRLTAKALILHHYLT